MDKCKRCGKCCYNFVILWGGRVVRGNPCPFLNDGEVAECVCYETRYEQNPGCLTIEQAKEMGVLPPDCGYMEDK